MRRPNFSLLAIAPALATVLSAATSQAAPTAAELCQSSKQMAAAKAAQCSLRARAGYAKTADSTKLTGALVKCDEGLQKGFDGADAKALGACTPPGDAATVKAALDACVADVDALVTGGAPPGPPPPGGAQLCASVKAGAAATYALCVLKAESVFSKIGDAAKRTAALAKCDAGLQKSFDGADAKFGGACALPGGASAVKSALDACTSGVTMFLMSGSNPTPTPTATPTSTPTPTPCIPYSSGTYTDNCNGTVTDSSTGLIWEQTTAGGDLHAFMNTFTWTYDVFFPGAFNGGAKEYLDRLNTPPCFANACTWRLPTLQEMAGPLGAGGTQCPVWSGVDGGIVDASVPGCGVEPPLGGTIYPCIDPIFGPTAVNRFYWTSTEVDPPSSLVWAVEFVNRTICGQVKTAQNYVHVRAVRDP